jgi:glycosyltransferase involved in cell wall biosynthesis
MGKKRVALIHLRGFFDTVPCLHSLVLHLAKHRVGVDIFILADEEYKFPEFDNSNIKIHILPGNYQLNPVRMGIQMLKSFIIVKQKLLEKHYDVIMGVDPDGLVLAHLVAINKNIRKWYISLELYFLDEIECFVGKVMKLIEKFCNRSVQFSVVQDKNRAKLLSEENNISLSRILMLPNANLGESGKRRSNFLKKRLNIEDNKKIILHIGVLSNRIMPFDIAENTLTWPDDWIMVFHTRNISDRNNDIFRKIKKVGSANKIKYSEYPVKQKHLAKLVASADIGIAFYKVGETPAMGKNLYHAGLSAGKIAQYLQYGVPVITNDLPVIGDMIRKYKCGIVLDTPTSLQNAIEVILNERDLFSGQAVKCFREIYSPEPYLNQILDSLKYDSLE